MHKAEERAELLESGGRNGTAEETSLARKDSGILKELFYNLTGCNQQVCRGILDGLTGTVPETEGAVALWQEAEQLLMMEELGCRFDIASSDDVKGDSGWLACVHLLYLYDEVKTNPSRKEFPRLWYSRFRSEATTPLWRWKR